VDLPAAQARSLFAAARVARLATVDAAARPHLVPVTFVLDGGDGGGGGGPVDRVWFAIDAKPKRTQQLRRLRNIEANPQVSLLVDEYDEDWERLWWVRADGQAHVYVASADVDPAAAAPASADSASAAHQRARIHDLLRAKYPQYAAVDVSHGPLVEIAVERWTGWQFSAKTLSADS
jgi:PPOX class probable F420-dependent enzyme